MKKILFLILASAGFALLSQCVKTNPAENIAGTGTLIGNPSASLLGSLYYAGGSPAKNIAVHIRKQNSLAHAPGSMLSNQSKDTASATTDAQGVFAFEKTLDSGVYVIEAQNGNDAVIINSVSVKDKTKSDTLPPDTLKPAGAIKGSIKLADGADPTNVYALAFGMDRFARVKSDGSFVFYPLAHGTYNLRFITTLENYGTLDTNNINVQSSDTTNLGTINLPYTGIPIPTIVSVSYDTLKQMVTVCWNKENSAVVKSYNIYSISLDSNGTASNPNQLNQQVVTDTFFIESIATLYRNQDGVPHTYQVSAVDSHETEGHKSAPSVSISSSHVYEKVENKIGQVQNSGYINFCTDNQNNFWMVDFDQNKLIRIDASGNLISELSLNPSPALDAGDNPQTYIFGHFAMDIDAQKNIYIKDSPCRRILKYDSLGNLVNKTNDSATMLIADVSVDTSGYVYSYSLQCQGWGAYSIYKYNPDLTLNKSWGTNLEPLNITGGGLIARNGEIYCSGLDVFRNGVVQVYSDQGVLKQTIQAAGAVDFAAVDIAMDKNGRLYCLDVTNRKAFIMSEAAGLIGQFDVSLATFSIFNFHPLAGLAVLGDGTIALGFCKEPSDTGENIIFYKK
jgi:hypothetical protein